MKLASPVTYVAIQVLERISVDGIIQCENRFFVGTRDAHDIILLTPLPLGVSSYLKQYIQDFS